MSASVASCNECISRICGVVFVHTDDANSFKVCRMGIILTPTVAMKIMGVEIVL